MNADGTTGYYSVLYVKASSPYMSIEDLKGKNIGLVDPNSTSGNNVPRYMLDKMKINPETYFGKVVFTGSHENAVLALSQGTVDVAANDWTAEDNSNLTRMLAKGMLKNADGSSMKVSDFRIIMKSDTIRNGPLTVLSDMPADAKEAIAKAFMDAATADLAARLVDELELGQGTAPDLLSVSLSATDYVGHAYGTEGMEMCIQMAELDRTLGRLLAKLDATGVDYLVFLTADHGGLDLPERLAQQGQPGAVRVDPALAPAALGKALGAQLGLSSDGPLLYGDGPSGDFWVTKAISPEARARVIDALAARLRAHPEVAAVFTRDELAQVPVPAGSPQDWTLRDRARASFDLQRSGDVVMLLNRVVVPIPVAGPGYVATHGSAWDYDRRVPLLFWRKGWTGFEQPGPVETVDIAPSLAAVLGLKVPEGTFDGRCLDLDGGPGNSCR